MGYSVNELKNGDISNEAKSNIAFVTSYLKNNNFADSAIVGILANMNTESDFDFTRYNPDDYGSPSGGICQWRGTRLTDLDNFCRTNYGVGWRNCPEGQMAFLVLEMTPGTAYYSNGAGSGEDGSALLSTAQRTSNTESSAVNYAYYFAHTWERPASSEIPQRLKYAEAIYNSSYNFLQTSSSNKTTTTPLVSTPQTVSAGEAIAAVALSEYENFIKSNKSSIKRDGENSNKYTDWYGYDGDWCAMFCSYCVKQAGIDFPFTTTTTNGEAVAGPNSGFYFRAKENGLLRTREQIDQWRVGDIAFFLDESGEVGHVGIIVEIRADGTIVTVEGNVHNDEGPSYGYDYRGWVDDVGLKVRSPGSYYYPYAVLSFSGVSDVPLPSGSDLSYASASTISSDQKLNDITYKEVQVDIKSSHIATADADANTLRTKSNSLLDTPTLVESPFIILKIGNYTFGSYSATGSFEDVNSSIRVTYPNYMNSIRITKVNGQVNQYIITIIYQIENGNDPNLLDKIFSSVGYGTVYISYGDWNAPKFAYRDEEAIITRLDSNVDFSNSRITYTLYCTSNALMLMGGFYNFGPGNVKPSDEIYRMMYAEENKYHLQEIFTAFKGNEAFFRKCVASDDVVVEVVPKIGMDALSYVNYLVTCMSPTTTPKGSPIRDANYYLTIYEDRETGTYFTVKKVSSTADIISLNNSDVYEVDVGYPGDTLVTQFKINSDNSWDLLYQYSDNIRTQDYIYNIDAQGQIYESYSPNVTTSATYLRTTETQRNWWTQMTQFPITAILTIKGLLRPAMLMSYVRVNAMFYGMRHVSSGLYLIVKQEDTVDMTGYRTTLTLQRIAGDLDTIVTETRTVTKLVPQFSHDINPRRSSNNRTTYQDIMEHVQEDVDFMERAEEEGLGSFVDKTQILYDQNTINENIAWAVDQMQQGIDPSENLRGSMPQLADEILDYIHYDEWRKDPESWSPPNIYGFKTSDSSQSKTLRALQDAVDKISGTIVGTNSGG